MTGWWIAAFVALAATTLLLAAFNLGLARRTIAALESIEQGAPVKQGPTVGETAPALPSGLGVDAAGGAVVLFLEAGCDPCEILAADLRRGSPDLRPRAPVAIADSEESALALPTWATFLDTSHQVFNAWQVKGTPHAFVVDERGVIVTKGYPNTSRDLMRLVRAAPSRTGVTMSDPTRSNRSERAKA